MENARKAAILNLLQKQVPEPVESDDEEENAIVVIDNGSKTLRAGFGDADTPRHELMSLVGRLPANMVGVHPKEAYFGEDLFDPRKRRVFKIQHPMEDGKVTNWDDLESLWHNTIYNELRVELDKRSLVVTESVQTPLADREKMASMLFECFNAHAIFIANRPLMSLYASGRTTGLVVQIGHGAGIVVPIIEGKIVEEAVTKLPLGGNQISEHFLRLLVETEQDIDTNEFDFHELKEKYCYVAQDFEAEKKTVQQLPSVIEKHHDLKTNPDEKITIASERFAAPEVLFKPELLKSESDNAVPLHRAVLSSILKCDCDIRKELFQNIVLAGGTCMLPGLADRLQMELVALGAPEGADVAVHPPPDKNTAWTGAAVLSSVPEFSDFWVTKEMFETDGPSAVHDMSA